MVCGVIMTMRGLPRVPSSERTDIDASGKIVVLFGYQSI
jgi:formyltetrahydrofolate synthetase